MLNFKATSPSTINISIEFALESTYFIFYIRIPLPIFLTSLASTSSIPTSKSKTLSSPITFPSNKIPSSSSQPSRCFPPCEYLCESYHQPPSPHLLSSTIHFHLPSDNTPHLPLLICSYFIFLAIFSSLPFADLHLPPFFACNMSASYHPLKIIKKSAINLPFDRFRLKPSKIYEEELSYYLMLPGKYELNRLFLLPLSCPQIHPHADPLTTTLPPCYKLSSPFEKQNHQQL